MRYLTNRRCVSALETRFYTHSEQETVYQFVRDYETVKVEQDVLNEFLLVLNEEDQPTDDDDIFSSSDRMKPPPREKAAYYKNIERKMLLKKKRANVRPV